MSSKRQLRRIHQAEAKANSTPRDRYAVPSEDLALGPESLGICDNCNEVVTEDDDYVFDTEGFLHEACGREGSND